MRRSMVIYGFWLVTGFYAVGLIASGLPAQAQAVRDTSLQMRTVTVKDQNQLRGRYGDAWTEDEVRSRAGQVCAGAGMRMVYFQSGNSDSQGRTEFAAVCQ